jgi:hypothetical protein
LPAGVGVGGGGQSNDVVGGVGEIEAVEVPGFVLCDRARKGDAWDELVEADSVVFDIRGNKVGGVETVTVIAHAAGEGDDAARGFAVFDGITRALGNDGTDRVGAEVKRQSSAGWRAEIEAIEQVEGCVGGRSGDVDLAGGILNDAGVEGQKIDDVAVGDIGNIDDLRRVHGADVGRLLRIDVGSGGDDVDLLTDDLLVLKDQLDVVKLRVDVPFEDLIEARLVDLESIGYGRGEGEFGAAGGVREEFDWGLTELDDSHPRVGHHHIVFVEDC